MKNILYTIAGLVLISSCSIAKRQYNSGFAIDFNKKRNQPIEVETVVKSKSQPVEKAELAIARNQTTDQFTKLELSSIESKNQTISLQLNKVENKDQSASKAEVRANKAVKKLAKIASKKMNISSFENEKINTNSISANPTENNSMDDRGCIISVLIFLCCLFIAPLGYYLSTGEADTKFWICLICYLLGGGLAYAAGYAFGLLALIAVIIALIAFFSN